MKDNTPEDLKQALEAVIHIANTHKACLAGFVWSDKEPIFICRFGNVKEEDAQFKRLIVELCEVSITKHKLGLVNYDKVLEVV